MSNSKIVTASAKKPPNAGMGRKKGVPNKTTQALKDMILLALDKSGGVDYLITQAETNPNAFLSLVGKVLPMTVLGGGADGSHVVSVNVKFD